MSAFQHLVPKEYPKLITAAGKLTQLRSVTVHTVGPLLSAVLRPKFGTPNLYEVQYDLYYPGLYYLRFLRPKFSTPKYRG